MKTNGWRNSRRSLESPRHPLVREIRRLALEPGYRRDSGRLVVEGPHLVREAVGAGWFVENLIASPSTLARPEAAGLARMVEAAGGEVLVCGERVIRAASDTEHPQGLLAIVRGPEHGPSDPLASHPPFLVVDAVQDPGNVGTLIRAAAAAGCGGVLLGGECADALSPKVLRASAGTVFRIPVRRAGDRDTLEEGMRRMRELGPIWGLDAHRGSVYHEVHLLDAAAFVVGNEARGISEAVAGRCTGFLRIPLSAGVESLNAAVSAAVVLFEAARQRGAAPGARSL